MREETNRPRTLKEWWLLNMPESHRSQEPEPEIRPNTLVETAPPENIPMYLDPEK